MKVHPILVKNPNPIIQYLGLNDYSSGKPYIKKPCSLSEFLSDLIEDAVSILGIDPDSMSPSEFMQKIVNQFYRMSGDGHEHFVLTTIMDGKIQIIPSTEE